ncbi:MAG: AAA family ATPase, partial [Jiangellales bacterium]
GTSHTLLLSGEAGIGKSRLIDEARARLADRVQVVSGRCLDCGAQPAPYVAVMDALHGLVADLGVERVARAAGPGRAELARLEPMLGPAAKDSELGRTRLMEAVVELVEGLSAQRPMMLVIEDVHWADPSTLDLIGFCAATVQGPVLLVLTYRSEELCAGDRLSVWLSETRRRAHVDAMVLGRLDENAVARIVHQQRPDVTQADVEAIVGLSSGIPFYVEELAACEHPALGAPVALLDVVRTRLETLSPPARHLVGAAGLARGTLDEGRLARVTELSSDAITGALREVVDHHVLVPDQTDDSYEFRHGLLKEAAASRVLPGEGRRLHAAWAATLEQGRCPRPQRRHRRGSPLDGRPRRGTGLSVVPAGRRRGRCPVRPERRAHAAGRRAVDVGRRRRRAAGSRGRTGSLARTRRADRLGARRPRTSLPVGGRGARAGAHGRPPASVHAAHAAGEGLAGLGLTQGGGPADAGRRACRPR